MVLPARTVAQGNPPVSDHQVDQAELADWMEYIERLGLGGIGHFRNELAGLPAASGVGDGAFAVVLTDATEANRGIYEEQSDAWVKVADLPPSYQAAADILDAKAAAEGAQGLAEDAAAAARLSAENASGSADATALSEANAAASEAAAYTHRSQSELAALASGRAIVTSLTSPVPSEGAIELLQTGPGMQVCQVVAGAWVAVGWLGELLYDDAAALLAAADTGFAAGQVIRTRREGFAYVVAPAPAIDQHRIMAGGARLYVLPALDGRYHARAFGSAQGGALDDVLDVMADMALAAPTEPFILYLDDLEVTLEDAAHHGLPANLRIEGRSTGRVVRAAITVTHVDGGITWARPATLPGGIDQETWWGCTIAGFSHVIIRGFGTKQVARLVEIRSLINVRCISTHFTNAVIGLRRVNTLGRWCEFHLFENCVWESNAINHQMDVDGGTNSMGHGRFINCYMGLDDGAVGLQCLNGASPYNTFFQFNTFTRNGSAFLDLDNGSIKKCVFALTFENRSTGGTFMRAANTSDFRGNMGSVSSFSSSIGYMIDDGTTTYGQASNAGLIFTGMIWDRGDGVALANAEDVPTCIMGHPNKRVPVGARQVTITAAGTLAGGDWLGVIPRAPGEAHEWRVYRIDIWVRTPGSGNTGGGWKLDISKSAGSMNTMLGSTDLVIADGPNNHVIHTDIKLGAPNWYADMSGLWSLPAEPGVANDGAPPEVAAVTLTMC